MKAHLETLLEHRCFFWRHLFTYSFNILFFFFPNQTTKRTWQFKVSVFRTNTGTPVTGVSPIRLPCICSQSQDSPARLGPRPAYKQALFVCPRLTITLPFIFKHYSSCPPVCPLVQSKWAWIYLKAIQARASERRKGRKKSWGKKGGKNCETPMYFICSYIIHFEMHLGWCKSVQRHRLFQAFTLKCLCGWSVLRQFGPTSLPHPQP